MEFEENNENNEDTCEEEGEVNLEKELISALCDLKKERKKKKQLKEELSKMCFIDALSSMVSYWSYFILA